MGAEYAEIAAAVQSVKLPSQLTLPAEAGSKHGVKKDDQPLCDVILRDACLCETAMKVLQCPSRIETSLQSFPV